MIYNEEYKIKFYINSRTGEKPALDYVKLLDKKTRQKVNKYIEFLRENKGYLNEPYSRHISGKIRELRVDFNNGRHRIFYFSFLEKKIILLNAFLKNTDKTPIKQILIAENNYQDAISNSQLYE
jgi:phage-related protein